MVIEFKHFRFLMRSWWSDDRHWAGPFGGGWSWKIGAQGNSPLKWYKQGMDIVLSLLVAEIRIQIGTRSTR